jgi:hypothetical protein
VAKEHFGSFWRFLEVFGAPICGAVFPFGFCESLFLNLENQLQNELNHPVSLQAKLDSTTFLNYVVF